MRHRRSSKPWLGSRTIQRSPDAPGRPDADQRQDLLHRDSRPRHPALGGLLRQSVRLDDPKRGDGATAFDDATGQVSGTWVLGRPAASQPGLLVYIMVDSVAATIDTVTAQGGTLVQPIGADAPEVTARFRDPGGHVIGLYQEPSR